MNGHDYPELFEPTAEEAEYLDDVAEAEMVAAQRADWLVGMVDDGDLPGDLNDEAIAALLDMDWYESDNGNRGALLAHPDCPRCSGTGYREDFDWVPYRGGLAQNWYTEACSCTERARS